MNKIFYKISIPFRGKGLGKKFPILRKMQEKVVKSCRKNFVITRGHKMYLDEFDELNLSLDRENSPDELFISFMKSKIHEGDTILDLGANIGCYTLLFAKWVGDKGKVYAFEPDSINFKLLELNILINGYKNIIPIQKAVSNKKGKAKLYISNAKAHNLYRNENEQKYIEVGLTRLDDEVKGKIDFIKMDIEGAEGEAVAGMENVLKNNRNIKMIFEYKKYALNKSEVNSRKILELLEKQGFSFYDIRLKKEMTKKEILKERTEELEDVTDLFAFRK